MPNFVDDGTPLPFPKTDLKPIGSGDPNKHVSAEDWNEVCQAVDDIRTKILGFLPDGTQPLPTSPNTPNPGNSPRLAKIDHVHVGAGGGNTLLGWLNISNVTAQGGGTVSNQVWDDSPNNTIIQSATSSTNLVTVFVKSSSPRVTIGGTPVILPPSPDGGHYAGSANVTLPALGGTVTCQLTDPNGALGAYDTVTLTVDAPPAILTLTFTGGYPGAQTELKAGDTFQVSGTTDKPCVGAQSLDFGAATAQTFTFASTTSFSVTVTIADRGTTPQSLAARLRARNAAGAYGPTFDTTNTVVLNNLYPTATFGAKTYPISQQALKASETADVAVTLANLDTVLFDSPNGDLSIALPTTIGTPKTVTRIAGSYNISVNNLRVTATRNANAAVTINQTVVNIANVAPTIDVTVPAARLRSGGNNGTSIQGHTVTITSNQQLLNAPSLAAGVGGGTFTGGGFAGGPSIWTRTLNVHDNDVKGGYTFTTLVATGLAGLVQNTINSGAAYTLGGFVQRTLTFAAFATTTSMGVAVIDFTKLQAGVFTATNQPALKQPIGTSPPVTNGYTINALTVNPTTVIWLDTAAAASNSGGTAQITNVEETV